MKINKRERNLLIILLCIGIGYLYYTFVYIPQRENIETLKAERSAKRQEHSRMEDILRTEGNIDLELGTARDNIRIMARDYFGDIDQEEAIVVLSDLARDSKLIFNRMSFTEPQFDNIIVVEEAEGETTEKEEEQENIRRLSSSVEFEGNYNSLMDLLRGMKGFPKNILSTNMNISADEEGNLRGNIAMDFYSVLSIDKYSEPNESILSYRYIGGSPQMNPFSSYLWARTTSVPNYASSSSGPQMAQGVISSIGTGYNVNQNTGQNNIHNVYGSGVSKDTFVSPESAPKGSIIENSIKGDKYSIQMIAFDRESTAQNYVYILDKQMMPDAYYINNGLYIVYHGMYNSFAEALNDLESLKRYSKDAFIVKLDDSQVKAYNEYKISLD